MTVIYFPKRCALRILHDHGIFSNQECSSNEPPTATTLKVNLSGITFKSGLVLLVCYWTEKNNCRRMAKLRVTCTLKNFAHAFCDIKNPLLPLMPLQT